MIAIFYQRIIDEHCHYLTLQKTEIDTIKKWIDNYFKDDKAEFPYKGEMPNKDVNFTIDFKRDIEIVKAVDLKTDMSEYNKEHNAQHNKDLGRQRVVETFSRLLGDQWTTQEILQQGFNDKNIKRFVDYGLIERISRGKYNRLC